MKVYVIRLVRVLCIMGFKLTCWIPITQKMLDERPRILRGSRGLDAWLCDGICYTFKENRADGRHLPVH